MSLDYALRLFFQCTNDRFQSLDGRSVILRTQLGQSGHALSSLHALALREFHLFWKFNGAELVLIGFKKNRKDVLCGFPLGVGLSFGIIDVLGGGVYPFRGCQRVSRYLYQ